MPDAAPAYAPPKLNWQAEGLFDLDPALIDASLRVLILECIALQRDAASAAYDAYRAHPGAADEVSPGRLAALLARSKDVHGIATDRSLSNAITFSAKRIADTVTSIEVEHQRKRIDGHVQRLARRLFARESGITLSPSGHLWYPPGGWMGWHTNSRAPGWRLYISYAELPGLSFFRYREPGSGEIVTLTDAEWNLRLFRIHHERPLWHAVYSDTHRFSLGYLVTRRSARSRFLGRVRRALRRPAATVPGSGEAGDGNG